MSTSLNLKEIEKKAFRSTYQDGLWDIYAGCLVASMAILALIPESDELPWMWLGGYILAIAISYLVFWAGKKYITLPRLGQVKFGEQRRRRKLTLAIILGIIVAIQVIIVLFSIAAWNNPGLVSGLGFTTGDLDREKLLVSVVGALFVGPSMALVAYFNDFPRGYYIAVVLSLAVFFLIWFDQPMYLLAAGALILIPGLVFFVRFLIEHPLPAMEA